MGIWHGKRRLHDTHMFMTGLAWAALRAFWRLALAQIKRATNTKVAQVLPNEIHFLHNRYLLFCL